MNATRYYLNGDEISGPAALLMLENVVEARGSVWESFEDTWDARHDSEEARDALNEVSGYTLEIVVSD